MLLIEILAFVSIIEFQVADIAFNEIVATSRIILKFDVNHLLREGILMRSLNRIDFEEDFATFLSIASEFDR